MATEIAKSTTPEDTESAPRLSLASPAGPRRFAWDYAAGIVAYHVVAALSFLPWFFSRTGVVLAILGLYVFGTLGINVCYHRLLAHRAFSCPKWLERTFAILGVCCLQDTPAEWIAVHRRHHQYADGQNDPHSPQVNFFWSHLGWLLVEKEDFSRLRYSKDILSDRFYASLERGFWWLWIVLLSWVVFFSFGFAISLLGGGTLKAALQFGLSILIWGVFVRTVLVWHITWSVNSVTHVFGYRNYVTNDDSRNNVFVGLISNGEGWHNNHHADQRSARHGHFWWELDVTYLTIRFLGMIGLARNIALPSTRATE